MDCSIPALPVPHYLLEFVQVHVHWVGDAIQPSHPLPHPSPFAFNLSQHRGLYRWLSSSHPWPRYYSFSISPSNEYSGLISFRIDWLDLVSVQRALKSLSNVTSAPMKHRLFSTQVFVTVHLSHRHAYWKDHTFAFTYRPLSAKWHLHFYMLISRLQSPSAAMILEPKKGKSVTAYAFDPLPFYSPWSDGTGCHDLSFLDVVSSHVFHPHQKAH